MIKLIIIFFMSVSFYVFYQRKLSKALKPALVAPISALLTLVSLAPMGFIIGLIGAYAIPKLLTKPSMVESTICAKCGTLSKKGETTCRKCKNALS